MIINRQQPALATLLIALGALLLPASGAGAEPPAAPEASGPALPSFEPQTLDNGLVAVIVADHQEPVVSLRLVLPAGQLFAPADQAGLAAATAELLTAGTADRSAQEISQVVASLAGFAIMPTPDQAVVTAEVAPDRIDTALALAADLVVRPVFPPPEVEAWRRDAQAARAATMRDPSTQADLAFRRLLYGSHPYGQPPLGTAAGIAGLTRADLVAFHARNYRPNGSVLAVVGQLDAAAVRARIEALFGAWETAEEVAVPRFERPRHHGTFDPPSIPPHDKEGRPRAAHGGRIVVVDRPEAPLTEIRVGQIGIRCADPDHFIAEVYNAVVGGGREGRLGKQISTAQDPDLSARSERWLTADPGPILATAATPTRSAVETLARVLEVLSAMEREAVPEAELAARKSSLQAGFVRQLSTPGGIAELVTRTLFHGRDREYLAAYHHRIAAVTAREVRTFAQLRASPQRALTVLVGNASGFAAELRERFGTVEIIPHDELDLGRDDLRRPDSSPLGMGGSKVR